MATCPQCGLSNDASATVCTHCGAALTQHVPNLRDRQTRPLSESTLQKVYQPSDTSTLSFTDYHELVLNLGQPGYLVFRLRDGDSFTIGRGMMANHPDIAMDKSMEWQAGLSREHASIKREDNHLYVSDMGSTNGTFLNNTRLERFTPQLLRDGDLLACALLDMRIQFMVIEAKP